MTAAQWIASEIIGNEVMGFGPLPLSARDEIAQFMVSDDRMGWPSIEAAQATLNDWEWTEVTA